MAADNSLSLIFYAALPNGTKSWCDRKSGKPLAYVNVSSPMFFLIQQQIALIWSKELCGLQGPHFSPLELQTQNSTSIMDHIILSLSVCIQTLTLAYRNWLSLDSQSVYLMYFFSRTPRHQDCSWMRTSRPEVLIHEQAKCSGFGVDLGKPIGRTRIF